MNVLIADDHEVVRLGLRELLTGHNLIEADDGEAALNLYQQHRPDVTLLDVRMPHDGFTCLAQIKLADPNARVIMFSGHENPTYVARAAALGAQGYLLKSATGQEILAAVKAVARDADTWATEGLRRTSGRLSASYDLETPLTKREREVLAQLAQGLRNKEIGQALGISYETVKEHVQHIFRKLEVSDRTQAAVWAVRKELG